jgi:DNA-binding NarL/FixJ family response regulator
VRSAQSARLRDLDAESLDWAERTVALTHQLGGLDGVRLAALLEKGALLTQRAASMEDGRTLLARVADEAEQLGEYFHAAAALNKLLHLPLPSSWGDLHELLERMRSDAERAGSEHLAVAAYHQGRARLFMRRGDLARATDSIERGRANDLVARRTVTKVDNHGAFLVGLRLEAGDVEGAARIAAELVGIPGMEVGLPGMEFHIACRRHDLARARGLLPDVIAVAQATGGRNGEFLHDLVSAALAAPLELGEVTKLVDGLDGPGVDRSYRALVAGQLAEAGGDHAVALEQYRTVAQSAPGLPPAARGTAEVGIARCLLALGREDEAHDHVEAAGELLARWGGWRGEQLDAVRERLGLREPTSPGAVLTPREREVALLIADGLTNADLARRLHISPRTAAVHVSAILRKLGVASRTEVGPALAAHP